MRIDGTGLATQILDGLIVDVQRIQRLRIVPRLAVCLVGDDPASLTYISRKRHAAEYIGVLVDTYRFPILTSSVEALKHTVETLNQDATVHGIIIQRPVPLSVAGPILDTLVAREKDVDGFRSDSPYLPPIGMAILAILSSIKATFPDTGSLTEWMAHKRILVIGRGETGGKPIAQTLERSGIRFTVAHSKTHRLDQVCAASDIIISCIGKRNIVRHQWLQPDTILLGVGLHVADGKLEPDYIQKEVSQRVAFYSPVPGGVGPVNVACLLKNVVSAATRISAQQD